MEFAIRFVVDQETGEELDAEIVFASIQEGQKLRKDFFTNDRILLCKECKERATIGTNTYGRPHFKHYPNTRDCVFKDIGLTEFERKEVEEHLSKREGPRHLQLKAAISKLLSETEGVVTESIWVDNKFIVDENERRRPDVRCEFYGKTLAFEIQLSKLPARYIFKRHEFYKRNGIYLIWILDNFDVHGQSQTERDIKYLTEHQNFFFFNDHGPRHTFVVQYKMMKHAYGFVTYPWTHEFVVLNDLTYDEKEYHTYFKSYAEQKRIGDRAETKDLFKTFFRALRAFYISDHEKDLQVVTTELEKIDYPSILKVNNAIGLTDNSDLLFKCVAEMKSHFLTFILDCDRLEKNVNSKDSAGVNLLERIIRTKGLMYKSNIIQLLFNAGYRLSESDELYISSKDVLQDIHVPQQHLIIQMLAYNRLSELRLMRLFDKYEGPVHTILSAKYKRVMGFGFNNIISVANNAIHSYKTVWHTIDQAFTYYRYWDEIWRCDLKGTFKKKLADYNQRYREIEKSDEGFIMFKKLFPEIYGSDEVEWVKVVLLPNSSQ